MHGVEELAQAPYLFGATVPCRAILPDGSEVEGRCRRHHFSGWGQRYDRIEPLLKAEGLRVGNVLKATVYVLGCRPMWERALSALQRDPFFFVEKREV